MQDSTTLRQSSFAWHHPFLVPTVVPMPRRGLSCFAPNLVRAGSVNPYRARRTSLRRWNVLDRSGVPIEDHVVWEPVNFLVPVFVDVGGTDVRGAHILLVERGIDDAPARRLCHFLVGLVLLARHISLPCMLDVHARDLSAFHYH